MNLFRANADDVHRIKECAIACCAEHGEERTGGPLDWQHYYETLVGLLADGRGAMWLYSDDDGKIVAGLCGARYIDPLTGLMRASRIFIYVLPTHRGTVNILRLFRLYEAWAREEGCQVVTMSVLDTMPPSTASVYERLGYVEQETIYLKRL